MRAHLKVVNSLINEVVFKYVVLSHFHHSLTHEFEREARECRLCHSLMQFHSNAYSNTDARIQVRFEGHGGITGTSENSSIAVSENEIVINTRTPKSLKEYNGVTIVRVSLDQSRFTNEDTTSQHVFDTRYELDTNITTYLRISPTTSAFAGQSIAFNTISRKRFDERVVYDVAGSVGLARDRLVVLGVDSHSGVLALECVPSRLPADPKCEDALKELSDLVAKPTSSLYNGIVTWALDPLFPKGTAKIDPITGKAYVEGSCSDSRFFTEATCLSAGFCQCNIGPDREGDNVREKCEASFYPGGKQCRFVPYNGWSDDGVTTLRFGKCSDPTKASKEECLEDGTCSNPKLKGRKACLREGYCTGTWMCGSMA